MEALERIEVEIGVLEAIPLLQRTDAQLTNLTGLRVERARLSGNNCVVFIMWLLSGDCISSPR
jgi:hypothetical protein